VRSTAGVKGQIAEKVGSFDADKTAVVIDASPTDCSRGFSSPPVFSALLPACGGLSTRSLSHRSFGHARGRTRNQTLETNADFAPLRWHRSSFALARPKMRMERAVFPSCSSGDLRQYRAVRLVGRYGIYAMRTSFTDSLRCRGGEAFSSCPDAAGRECPNQAASGNGAVASRFHAAALRRAVPALRRSGGENPT
jgi:hypothetical protein